jgi:hypothetical protein
MTDPKATIHARHARQLWGSATTDSVMDPQARIPSPADATSGSNEMSGYEVVPSSRSGPVSQLPAIRLPCRLLGPEVGKCFDRVEVLKILDEKLLPPGRPDVRQTSGLRTFALAGQGGVGKTHIAREFVSRRQSSFDAIFWVSAETEGKLAASFNEIAAELGLLDPSGFGNAVVSRNRVVNWLSNPLKSGRGTGYDNTDDVPPGFEDLADWLLVFDNADNLDLLTEYWPITGTGSILITSRDPLAKQHMWTGVGVDLEGLEAPEAAVYLQEMALIGGGEPLETGDAIRLSERLTGLPIPLMRASGILLQRNMTVGEFLDYYEERAFLAEIYGTRLDSVESLGGHDALDVWSYGKLKASQPQAMRLLEILALLDPDSIPEFILVCKNDGLALPAGYPRSTSEYEAARNVLLKSSLVKRDTEKQELVIHRVIQDSVVAQMCEADLKANFGAVITLLTEAWPWASGFNHLKGRWSRCGQVFPHVELARDQYIKLPDPIFPEALLLCFAKLLVDAGWYEKPV